MSSKLKVTLERGLVGLPPDQRKTIRALGLRRIGQTVEKEDRPEIRGMVFKVKHLVAVEEPPKRRKKTQQSKAKESE